MCSKLSLCDHNAKKTFDFDLGVSYNRRRKLRDLQVHEKSMIHFKRFFFSLGDRDRLRSGLGGRLGEGDGQEPILHRGFNIIGLDSLRNLHRSG